jgi:hypothetical protein
VSRYNFAKWPELVPVQDVLNGRGRGIGISNLSWEQEQNAKTVTNNLPLLSVLWLVLYCFL